MVAMVHPTGLRAPIALVCLWSAVVGLAGCSDPDGGTAAGTTAASAASDETAQPGSGESGEAMQLVEMQTTAGNIVIELRADAAPNTVANFLAYADSGFYDGSDGSDATIIHRIVPGFIIQGGGLTLALENKPAMDAIESEAGALSNERGTIAMALAAGDANSATSQFFINLTNNPELDQQPAFTVFATVALGMDIVDAMSMVETTTVGPYEGVPASPIVIETVNAL